MRSHFYVVAFLATVKTRKRFMKIKEVLISLLFVSMPSQLRQLSFWKPNTHTHTHAVRKAFCELILWNMCVCCLIWVSSYVCTCCPVQWREQTVFLFSKVGAKPYTGGAQSQNFNMKTKNSKTSLPTTRNNIHEAIVGYHGHFHTPTKNNMQKPCLGFPTDPWTVITLCLLASNQEFGEWRALYSSNQISLTREGVSITTTHCILLSGCGGAVGSHRWESIL